VPVAKNLGGCSITCNGIPLKSLRVSEHLKKSRVLLLELHYLGPEGGRSGRPTQAVRHMGSGNLGIVKILELHHTKQISIVKKISQEYGPLANRGPVLKHT